MHYRREWVEIRAGGAAVAHSETHAEKFELLLKDRFAENPLAGKNLPFFPDRCLGHGCAEWAVTTSLSFTDSSTGISAFLHLTRGSGMISRPGDGTGMPEILYENQF